MSRITKVKAALEQKMAVELIDCKERLNIQFQKELEIRLGHAIDKMQEEMNKKIENDRRETALKCMKIIDDMQAVCDARIKDMVQQLTAIQALLDSKRPMSNEIQIITE
jgi:hypothetical protein